MWSTFLYVSLLTSCCLVASWDYYDNGPSTWAEDFPNDCSLDKQSPINIDDDTANIENGFDALETFYNLDDKTLLQFWDWNKYVHSFDITNNGHTLVLKPKNKNKGKSSRHKSRPAAMLPNFFPDTTEHSLYCLDSIHFHWGIDNTEGSEHTINNEKFACELHFVHYSCDYDSLADAISDSSVTDPYVLAVVGVMVEIDETSSNDVLSRIIEEIDNLEMMDDSITLNNVNLLGSFIPNKKKRGNNISKTFWHYKGSLTTPNCNQIVRWFVLDATVSTNSNELIPFRNILDLNGQKIHRNWRPVQTNVNTVYEFKYDDDDDNSSSDSDSHRSRDTSESSD